MFLNLTFGNCVSNSISFPYIAKIEAVIFLADKTKENMGESLIDNFFVHFLHLCFALMLDAANML